MPLWEPGHLPVAVQPLGLGLGSGCSIWASGCRQVLGQIRGSHVPPSMRLDLQTANQEGRGGSWKTQPPPSPSVSLSRLPLLPPPRVRPNRPARSCGYRRPGGPSNWDTGLPPRSLVQGGERGVRDTESARLRSGHQEAETLGAGRQPRRRRALLRLAGLESGAPDAATTANRLRSVDAGAARAARWF